MNTEQGQFARASYNKMSKVYGLLSNSSEKKFVELAIRQVLKPEPAELIRFDIVEERIQSMWGLPVKIVLGQTGYGERD